jgi:hypothetical protein
MKTTLISEGELVTIILTPENEFEKDIIEKVYDSEVFSSARDKFNIKTNFRCSKNPYYSLKEKHEINISISKIKEAQS